MRHLICFVPFFLFLISIAPTLAASGSPDVIELPEIIKRGGSRDPWRGERIVPVHRGKFDSPKGQGSPTDTLLEELPLPISDHGVPGAIKQVRGVGRSAEDTSVEVFDVPLNPVQGGGFDFSVFPSYLWSDYEYEMGPSARSVDPHAVSGRISLKPWTADALSRSDGAARFQLSHSTAQVTQVSLAGKTTPKNPGEYTAAAVAGYSAGDLDGPSGGASFEWMTSPEHKVGLHVLGSQVEAKLRGSKSFPTPNARQTTSRLIPVLQSEWVPEVNSRLKTSVFLDTQSLRCESCGYTSRDISRQYGGDAQWEKSGWGIGGNLRYATYQTLTFTASDELYYSLRGSRMQPLGGAWWVEPAVLIKGSTPYGSYPEGHLGIKKDFPEADAGIYSRLSYSRKIPTLLDRYYEIPLVYRGNPALDPETAYGILIGGRAHAGQFENSLDFFYQHRESAIVSATVNGVSSRINFGTASVYSLIHSLGWSPSGYLGLRNSIAWAQSELSQSGTELTYTPEWVDTLSAEVFPGGRGGKWKFATSARISESSLASVTTRARVGGYTLWNFEARYRETPVWGSGWSVFARVENLLDRKIEIIQDYPLLGRLWIVALEAYL